jgi:hypothetical protein
MIMFKTISDYAAYIMGGLMIGAVVGASFITIIDFIRG